MLLVVSDKIATLWFARGLFVCPYKPERAGTRTPPLRFRRTSLLNICLWKTRLPMRTVFWQENQVQMIDQRLLPGEFVIASFATVDEVARSIREMYVRGAPAIGATGAYGMVVAAQRSQADEATGLLEDLRQAKRILD